MMSEAEVLALFERTSNWGNWPDSSELGTLNCIDPARRVAAARLVSSGRTVSLSFDLDTQASPWNHEPVVHRVLLESVGQPAAALHAIEIVPHGQGVTHLHALGHFVDGHGFDGDRTDDILGKQGLSFGSILAIRDGNFTRGVLLDVARAQGVEALAPGTMIGPDDLEAAERMAGITVGRGDALLVRSGAGSPAVRQDGHGADVLAAGLTAECLPWLHGREIAVYAGDCVEYRPQPYERVFLPLHMVGMVAMGLVQFDALDLEELARVAIDESRNEFLFLCAPLRIPGGTASAVNPLAVF
jgi:kynurenine formamidase